MHNRRAYLHIVVEPPVFAEGKLVLKELGMRAKPAA